MVDVAHSPGNAGERPGTSGLAETVPASRPLAWYGALSFKKPKNKKYPDYDTCRHFHSSKNAALRCAAREIEFIAKLFPSTARQLEPNARRTSKISEGSNFVNLSPWWQMLQLISAFVTDHNRRVNQPFKTTAIPEVKK